MDRQSFSDLIIQNFSQFLASGIVFYLFVIWPPLFMIFPREQLDLLHSPGFIALSSLALGLLLHVSRAFRLIYGSLGSSKEDVAARIAGAFGIRIETDAHDDSYSARCHQVATKIYETFVRIKHPEKYVLIQQARVFPDILASVLLSTMIFIITSLLFLTLPLLSLVHLEVSRKILSSIHPQSYYDSAAFLLIIAIVVLWMGKSTVSKRYRELTDYTAAIIEEAYTDPSMQDDTFAFLNKLAAQSLIIDDDRGGWRIFQREDHSSQVS